MFRLILSSALFLSLSFHALACVNTSYSRKEEKQITCTLTELIAGQFPEHSRVFYEREVTVRTAALAKNPKDVEARNDLAVAYLKLGRFQEAEEELLRIEKEAPDRYKTHANLGVLYKKAQEYEKAAHHTKKALEIQPEGHLGLGDYYLRMLEWRARRADGDPTVEGLNFLGLPCDDGPEKIAANPLVNREHLMTLIKADRHFADAYLLLGDVLYAKGDLQHAARAYRMSINLSENDPTTQDVTWRRVSLIEDQWRRTARTHPDYVFDRYYEFQIDREFEEAKAWLRLFKETEVNLLETGKKVDFAIVQNEMERRHPNSKPKYLEAGSYEGEETSSRAIARETISRILFLAAIGLGILLVVIGAFFVNRQLAAARA